MTISKEAIEAAKAAYWHEAHNGGGYSDKCYEAALTAALPFLSPIAAPDGWQPDASHQWFLDRIGEEITAGRKQNALTYLSCAFAEFSSRQNELRRLGAQMSNVIYNLAQTADLSVANREAMKELTSQWDAAAGRSEGKS